MNYGICHAGVKVISNGNIHKSEAKKSDDQTNIDKYRVASNFTYPIISKLIFLKFMIIMHLFYVKNVCKNAKNQYIEN